MRRAEIMCVDTDIHGKGSRCVREAPMGMSVQVPRSMMGAILDAHGIVTNHDGLAMYGDSRKVVEPRELLGQLANLFVGGSGEAGSVPMGPRMPIPSARPRCDLRR